MEGQQLPCPVCAGVPSIAVGVAHRGLRTFIVELLQRDQRGWRVSAVSLTSEFPSAKEVDGPDLVIVDSCGFPLQSSFPPERIVVIGPEPDPAYERVARNGGAGAWLASDRVGEDLSASARAMLGCTHGPNE